LDQTGAVKLAFLAFVAATLLAMRPAAACSVCGCGDPLVDASDSVPFAAPLRLALDFEVLTASAGSEEDVLATEDLTQVTLRPVVVWSPIEELNLVVQVPLVRKDWSLSGGDAHDTAVQTGLGDVDVGARWFLFRAVDYSAMSRQALGVIAGTTLPTGANDAQSGGERLDDHAQLGTGAFGPYVGLSYAWHRDPWNVYTSATLRLHGTNGFEYHYGAAVVGTARVDYRLGDRLALEAALDGRWAARDTMAGAEQNNTGGTVLALAPGLAVNPVGDVWLRGRVQIPTVTDLYGRQSVGPTFFLSAEMLVR
jgi:hypothetical protein